MVSRTMSTFTNGTTRRGGATKPENPTAEIDLNRWCIAVYRDNLQKGYNVMELSGMQRKRQETTAELKDKSKRFVYYIELLNFIYLKFRVMMGWRRVA